MGFAVINLLVCCALCLGLLGLGLGFCGACLFGCFGLMLTCVSGV